MVQREAFSCWNDFKCPSISLEWRYSTVHIQFLSREALHSVHIATVSCRRLYVCLSVNDAGAPISENPRSFVGNRGRAEHVIDIRFYTGSGKWTFLRTRNKKSQNCPKYGHSARLNLYLSDLSYM